MKKLLALLLTLAMIFTLFAGCKKKADEDEASSDDTVYADDEYYDDDEYSDEDDENYDDDEYYDDGDDEDDDSYYDEDDSDTDTSSKTTATKSNTTSSKTTSSKGVDSDTPYYENLTGEGAGLSAEAQRAEKIMAGEDEEFNKSGYVYDGNLARVANVIRKSKNGQSVKIVTYGGANTHKKDDSSYIAYGAELANWWKANIGEAEVVATGGDTFTSVMGSMLLENSVLNENPDMVILDFTVQDAFKSGSMSNSIAFDNMIRRILKANANTAIVILTMTGATQSSYVDNPAKIVEVSNTSDYQLEIAKYYQIPVIDFGGAFNEISTTLVEVTEKREYPVLLWDNISETNITLNSTGQTMLAAMVNGYFAKVNDALSSITTSGNAIPTVGYFADDTYMNSSFANVYQMAAEYEGHISGYSYDRTLEEYFNNGYYRGSDETYLRTYRHYTPENTSVQVQVDAATGTPYMTINIPEVASSTKRYFMFGLTSNINFHSTLIPSVVTFYPVTVLSYDKDGTLLSSYKGTASTLTESPDVYCFQTLAIPYNAVKIEIRAYCGGGTIDYYGIGSVAQN